MHRGGDRSGDPSVPAASGGGRFARGPSRWSGGGGGGGGGGSPTQRFSRGGDGGGRFHPYRGASDYSGGGGGGGGGGFRGGGDFGEQPAGPRQHRFGGGRGDMQDHDSRTNYVKLFIGSVPRTATEEDVRPLFEEHGDVLEVALIKDRKTGEQQVSFGCSLCGFNAFSSGFIDCNCDTSTSWEILNRAQFCCLIRSELDT